MPFILFELPDVTSHVDVVPHGMTYLATEAQNQERCIGTPMSDHLGML
jgi:hypothetical protein